MARYELTLLILLNFFIFGCSTAPTYISPENRIYTIEAGTKIPLSIDGKKMDMTFDRDMKVVSTEVLVDIEVKANEKALNKSKLAQEKGKVIGIFGSGLLLLAGIVGIIFKSKSWFSKKIIGNIEVK